LIAIDGSDTSKRAALKGLELAKEHGAKVLGVHIIDIDALNIWT
jgi:nucleotide-binding universal stress UspA family protein